MRGKLLLSVAGSFISGLSVTHGINKFRGDQMHVMGDDKKESTFPDYEDQIPSGYHGPYFKLSQDYPQDPPAPEQKPWEDIDFKLDPRGYANSLKTYVLQGNIAADWRPERNPVRKWYHIPWMHVGNGAREFIHGCTRERTSEAGELGTNHKRATQSWAVGIYNATGAYSIGQVWKDPNNPDPNKSTFANGTVVAKALFTEASVEEVPQLQNTKQWKINIHSNLSYSSPKTVKLLNLVQMDVAVKDPRAGETTGWVYMTFIYDKDAPGATPWDRLVPVGIMWGNDPGITPKDVENGKPLQETVIFHENLKALGTRLGWAGRLNGPIDNYVSACQSCHTTAQHQTRSSMIPPSNATDEERLHWFRNLKSNEPFDKGEVSLDGSLQMAIALANFHNAKEMDSLMRTEDVRTLSTTARANKIYTVKR